MATLQLFTAAGCGLAIGRYPRFRYNAQGGGGTALLGERDAAGWQPLAFDAASLSIPPLDWRTTRVLGLPLPPGLRITIEPQRLAGRWQPATGVVELGFGARFRFALAGLYQAPDLVVQTQLATGEVRGQRHSGLGQPLDPEGRGVLVGVAMVQPTGDTWLDRFLGLPDEALAVLRCRITPGQPALEGAPPAAR
jgi:hypothetical protein